MSSEVLDDGAVLVRWRTKFENDLIGFNVYRRVGELPAALINEEIIPGRGGASNGARYQVLDPGGSTIGSYYLEYVQEDSEGLALKQASELTCALSG